jgi:phosphoenolpyruvate carboxylase
MLPGWYGFGSAVEAYRAKHGEAGMARLSAMHQEWSFFATLLSNMDMVLAKSDIAIASRYADLVKDARCARRSSRASRPSTPHRGDAAADQRPGRSPRRQPAAQRSIRNRFPYLDPLNHVQVELLHRYRDGHQDERVRRGIHLSINGIAAGLRNSG